MSWQDAIGSVVCVESFTAFCHNQLSLNVGDKLVLLRKFQDTWYRGHFVNNPTKVGIFPAKNVHFASDPVPPSPSIRKSLPIAHSEVLAVLREWRELLSTENHSKLVPQITSLVNLRRKLIQSPEDSELKSLILDTIDRGSKQLGLDVFVRSSISCSLASIDSIGVVAFIKAHLAALSFTSQSASLILTEPFSQSADSFFDCRPSKMIVEKSKEDLRSSVLLTSNQSSLEKSSNFYDHLESCRVFDVQVAVLSVVGLDHLPSSILSNVTGSSLFNDESVSNFSCRIYLSIFLYSPTDDSILSETLTIPINSNGRVIGHGISDLSNAFLFGDLQADVLIRSDVYMVVRLGVVTYPQGDVQSLLKKTVRDSSSCSALVLVPIAVGVFNVSNVVESVFNNPSDVNIKLVAPNNTSQVALLHQQLVLGYPSSAKVPFRVRISLTAKYSAESFKPIVCLLPSYLPEPCNSLIDRHLVFFTFHSAVCSHHRVDNKSSSRNIEPEISLVDIDGNENSELSKAIRPFLYGSNILTTQPYDVKNKHFISHPGVNPQGSFLAQPVRFPVIYHCNEPVFEICLSLLLPAQSFSKYFIRIILRHVSNSRGRDASFAVSFIPLMLDGFFLSFKKFSLPLFSVTDGRLPSPRSVMDDVLCCIPRSEISGDGVITSNSTRRRSLEMGTGGGTTEQFVSVSLSCTSTKVLTYPSLIPLSSLPLLSSNFTDIDPLKLKIALTSVLETPIGVVLQQFKLICHLLLSVLVMQLELKTRNDTSPLDNHHLAIWCIARMLDHAYFDSDSKLILYKPSVEAFITHLLPNYSEFKGIKLARFMLQVVLEIVTVVSTSSSAKIEPAAQGLRVIRVLYPLFNLISALTDCFVIEDLKIIHEILTISSKCLLSSAPGGSDPSARVSILIGLSRGFHYIDGESSVFRENFRFNFLNQFFDNYAESTHVSGAILVPIAPWINLAPPEPLDPSHFTLGSDVALKLTLPPPPCLTNVPSVESKSTVQTCLNWISIFAKHQLPLLKDTTVSDSTLASIFSILLGFLSPFLTRSMTTVAFFDVLIALEQNSQLLTHTTANNLFGVLPLLLSTIFSTRSKLNREQEAGERIRDTVQGICYSLEALLITILRLLVKSNLLCHAVRTCLVVAEKELGSDPVNSSEITASQMYLIQHGGSVCLSWILYSISIFYLNFLFLSCSPLCNISAQVFLNILEIIFENLSLCPSIPVLPSLLSTILAGLAVSGSPEKSKNRHVSSNTIISSSRTSLSQLLRRLWFSLSPVEISEHYSNVLPRILELMSDSSTKVRDNGSILFVKTLNDLFILQTLNGTTPLIYPRLVLTSLVDAVHRHCHSTFIQSVEGLTRTVESFIESLPLASTDLIAALRKNVESLVSTCLQLFDLLQQVKNRSSGHFQIVEIVEVMSQLLVFFRHHKLKKLFEFHLSRLVPKLETEKYLAEAAYCLSIQARDLGHTFEDYQVAIDLLKKAADHYRTTHFLLKADEIYDQLLTMAQRFHHADLIAHCYREKATLSQLLTSRLPLPPFYRVSFYSNSIHEFSVKDWVYHSSHGERLSDFVAKLQSQFPQAKIHQKRSPVSSKDLINVPLLIQITTVIPVPRNVRDLIINGARENLPVPHDYHTPHHTPPSCPWCGSGECKCDSQSALSTVTLLSKPSDGFIATEAHTDVNVFYVSRAEIIDRDSGEDFEITGLRTVFDYYITENKFPCMGIRQRITRTLSRTLGPIESACYTLAQKNLQLMDILSEDLLSGKVSNIDGVSMILQGCIEASINGGVNRYMKVFFEPDKVTSLCNSCPQNKSALIDLKNILRHHFALLPEVLNVHRKHCSNALIQLHEHLHKLALQSLAKVDRTLNKFERHVLA
ncbi:hypothetical protein RCL1_005563 [Eukaryota sp. TZLM3-RCL]